MLTDTSDFVVGKDRRGRSTAVDARGLAGGCFTSKNAALRCAKLETDRKLGGVRLTFAQLHRALGRGPIGYHGEGLPAWWRLGPSTRGYRSYVETLPTTTSEDKRWLLVDIGIVAGFAMLCVAVGTIVS